MINIFTVFKDFFNLFIPNKCLNCGTNLHAYENFVCKDCLYKIPKTNFHNINNNAVNQVFWGRVNLEFAFAHYYFTKGSILQNLIHEIKYRGAKELAFELGKEIGFDLKGSDFHKSIDLIAPVPLHPSKEKKRNYNQSDWIARGIAEVLNIPYNKNILKRSIYTSTQTKKTRGERWENVKNAFEVNEKYSNNYKHIALVDDVLTTGATLEACSAKLLVLQGVKVSVVTLAYASD